jgi:hypothetical protein
MDGVTARLPNSRLIGAECCEACKFYKLHPNGGKCHRMPPTALLILGQGPGGMPAHAATMADWAPVNPDQWCGEFKRGVVLS